MDTALFELDEARHLAMAISAPAAAAQCTMFKAQLVGMVVSRSAVAVDTPEQFKLSGDIDQTRERLQAELTEKFGSRKSAKLLEFVAKLKNDDDVIDVDPSDD